MMDREGNPVPITGWTLRYEGFFPRTEGLREALCTVGNGYFATRGAAPESAADGTHYPGTYIAGCFNQLQTEIGGRTVENESLVNAPNWLPMTFGPADGDLLDLGQVHLLDHSQELDLRRGVLTRRLRVRDSQGRVTRATCRRFVHMGAAHLAAIETTIVPENWSGTLRIRSGLDGTAQNSGIPRYRDLASHHLMPVETRSIDTSAVLLVVETSQSHIRIAEAARTRLFLNAACTSAEPTVLTEPGRIGHEFLLDVDAKDTVTVEKSVAIATSLDHATSDAGTAAAGWLETANSFDEMLESHVLAWAHLWRRFAFDLQDCEDDRVLPVLRLHIFHLLQTASPNTMDRDVGLPARGLHGEAYRGHIFWDDLFVFPVLNLRLPELSRSLQGYRYHRLPAARRAALEAGHVGAMFPWQSGSDGTEQSALLHLNPNSGRWLPDTTYLQRHVGIAVAYNTWQYYQATGDREYLALQGAELILEIARFFASTAAYDREMDRYVIRGVVGPDEFHTAYPDGPDAGIDNNAYTNVMTTWLLLRAIEVLGLLPEHRRAELTEKLRLTVRELERWEHISRRMFVPFHSNGIISQFEGYEDLKELNWEDYYARYGNVSRLDRILEAENDSVNRYKISKQADVVMLFFLLSADELAQIFKYLGYAWDKGAIAPTTDYYMARTSGGSTLSAVVHAAVLAQSDPNRAFDLFVDAMRSDIADVQGGTTAEGIHLAAMTGTIVLLQRSFAGLDLRGDVLWLNPCWPKRLGTLKFSILYRGNVITLCIGPHQMQISSRAGDHSAVRVGCGSTLRDLHPGGSLEFPLPGLPLVSTERAASAK